MIALEESLGELSLLFITLSFGRLLFVKLD